MICNVPGRGERSPRWRRNQRLKCLCGGYHFPHRRGGGACDVSRTRVLHTLLRQGEDYIDAFAEWAWVTPGRFHTHHEPPF